MEDESRISRAVTLPADEAVFTHHHTKDDRRYKLCECRDCGRVSRCTPSNDYYIKSMPNTALEGRPLVCERCMLEAAGVPKGIPIVRMSL